MSQRNKENIIPKDFNLFNIEQNPLSLKGISSITKKNLSLLNSKYNFNRNQNRGMLNYSRKSFDNLLNKNNSKEFKRFNTQINVKKMNLKNKIPNHPENYDNNFILAKKNKLYGQNLNNNEQINYLTTNNNLQLNSDNFAKKIQLKFNQNIHHLKKYKITTNKIKRNNHIFLNKNDNNNFDNSKMMYNNLTNYKKNNIIFQKKIEDDTLYKSNLNYTMPISYIHPNQFIENNNTNINQENRINKTNNIIKLNKFNNTKVNSERKQSNQNQKKLKINKNVFKSNSKIEKKMRIIMKSKEKDADLSWDYGTNLLNKNKNNNFYKKSKSGIIPKNFHSERKIQISKRNQYQKEEEASDKEIDEIVDELELLFGSNEKNNKTFIEKGKNLLDDSSNLSELADDILKINPDQEIDDINIQETVPSTSNPDIDGVFDSSNNNILNMNNIGFNNPFGEQKMPNAKSYIVNNIYISSNEMKNKNNKLDNDINYNFFVVNEFNNTNNNIKNNINNNIPSLVTKTYKSPFIGGNMNTKINNQDINEIEDSEMNVDFTLFKKEQNCKVNQVINVDSDYSNNINNKINEENFISNNFNKENNFENQNNLNQQQNKKKFHEVIFSDSILRDILSSHKNTPSNNNLEIKEENIINKKNSYNEFIKGNSINNFNNENKHLGENNNNSALFDLQIKNNFFSENLEIKDNKINNSSKKLFSKKPKKHILFNLNNNIYIKFKSEDLITNSQVTDENGQILNYKEKNMDVYNSELKLANPKPIIKAFKENEIKINKEYIYVENLPERQILPDLYDEFEEQDLKSLEKSLERSVDKILH